MKDCENVCGQKVMKNSQEIDIPVIKLPLARDEWLGTNPSDLGILWEFLGALH